MDELKLVPGGDTVAAGSAESDLFRTNAADALNRRDIEMIKRSLVSMHKDCAELRSTIVALHGRQSREPSRGLFVSLGVLALLVVAGLSVARPQLDTLLREAPPQTKLAGSDLSR